MDHGAIASSSDELRRPPTQANIARYSPSGRVPTLLAGRLVIWDSLAILEYLAETLPEARLWHAGQGARARTRSAAAEMHAGDHQGGRRQIGQVSAAS